MTIVTPNILLIDDFLEDRETYRRYLLRDKQHKYRILEASTGEQALLLCQQQFPDVIVTDYLLPDINGLEFLDNLKTQFGQTNLPVIILTGQGSEQIAVQAMKGGAADYLVKKNTTQLNFIKAVKNVLEKTHLTRQLEESKTRFQDTNQAALQQAHSDLERRVQQRTDELQQANQELQTTLEELQVAEEELRQQNEELARSRQAIELERQHYQDLFEFAPDGYLVTDTWGNIREANSAAATLLGLQQKHLIGKPLLVYIVESERKAFRTRLANLQQVQGWEVYLQPRKGDPFSAMVAVSSIDDEQGQQLGWRWLLRDISDRKQMEQRLQAAHNE
ncbi:MAG: response regulator [Fischerella sp. CENA71]|nr:response regulator [Fischerella sp. CENA71]